MFKRKINSGYLGNPFDPRDVFEDEIFAGGSNPLPLEYRIDDLQFEQQGALPLCVAFAGTKMAEYQLRKHQSIVSQKSQPHLYYNSGGSYTGAWFRSVLETMTRRGLLSYKKMELASDIWHWDRAKYTRERSTALSIPFDGAHLVPGYVRISPERDKIKRAILDYGLLMTGVYANGGYWRDRTERKGRTDNHAVCIVGWNDDDSWIVFDSLQSSATFNGYHNLSKDYTFNSVYALSLLPADWKDIRDEVRELPENNANRYGQPRNFEAEVEFANKMLKEFKKFNNQSVLDASGRFWEMYIRAGVYGGYNISYRKGGLWYSGDLINDCYFWRRTGKHIFDFNLLRSKQ